MIVTMTTATRFGWWVGAVTFGAACLYGCGSDDSSSGGTTQGGGSTATGGSTAQGGSTADGGSTAMGGQGGGSSTGGAGGKGTGGGDACGDIGMACNGNCPGGLTCFQTGGPGFCIPAPADCGGFAGAMCPDTQPECMILSGADFGPCGTTMVRDCVCANSPGTIAGC
jgi:hypothetical protein